MCQTSFKEQVAIFIILTIGLTIVILTCLSPAFLMEKIEEDKVWYKSHKQSLEDLKMPSNGFK